MFMRMQQHYRINKVQVYIKQHVDINHIKLVSLGIALSRSFWPENALYYNM